MALSCYFKSVSVNSFLADASLTETHANTSLWTPGVLITWPLQDLQIDYMQNRMSTYMIQYRHQIKQIHESLPTRNFISSGLFLYVKLRKSGDIKGKKIIVSEKNLDLQYKLFFEIVSKLRLRNFKNLTHIEINNNPWFFLLRNYSS